MTENVYGEKVLQLSKQMVKYNQRQRGEFYDAQKENVLYYLLGIHFNGNT